MPRTILRGQPAAAERTDRAAPTDRGDPTSAIIADFRATMSQLKAASSQRLRKLGISMSQLHILFTIERHGEMTMTRLADMLDVSLSNATGLVDRLEERGYLVRDRIPTDRRVVLVRLAPAGEQMLREVDALSEELLRSVLDRLPSNQLRAVGHAISALRESVDAVVGEPTDPHQDHHPASTAAPRSGPTMPADHPHHAHGRD